MTNAILKQVYNSFNDLNLKGNLVIGLSGGPDSTFLLYCFKLLNDNDKSNNLNIFPVIVDHKLRKESSLEAKKVKQFASLMGFKAEIVEVVERYSSGNVQNWARTQRRNILYKFSKKYHASIVLGHHHDDQIETIFMRVLKKSGFVGLTGIKKISQFRDVLIFRPLIKLKKKQIFSFLNSNKIPFVNDKSNFDSNFERIKIRNLLSLFQNYNYINVENNLIRLSSLSKKFVKQLDKVFYKWSEKNVKYYSHGSITLDIEKLFNVFRKNPEFCSILVGKFIKNVGGKDFNPRKEKLTQNLIKIFNKITNKFTTGNVIVFVKNNFLNFIRENRNLETSKEIKKNITCIFDNRFVILSRINGKLILSKNKSLNIVRFKNNENFINYSKIINYSLPLLKTLEGKVVKPYLYIIEKKNINKINKSRSIYDLIFIKDNSYA